MHSVCDKLVKIAVLSTAKTEGAVDGVWLIAPPICKKLIVVLFSNKTGQFVGVYRRGLGRVCKASKFVTPSLFQRKISIEGLWGPLCWLGRILT